MPGISLADVAEVVDRLAAQSSFSGVVRVDAGGGRFERAYGFAHRGWRVPNEVGTRFAMASGTKGFTALTVVSLVVDGTLTLDTTARELLGDDLPLIADDVTVEHLLAHRSGIGDYFDEEAGHEITDHLLPGGVHEYVTTEDYLKALDGYPTVFPAGERFSYNNGGYVVLALLAERAAKTPFHDLVQERVLTPAGMPDTAFLRSDELPGGVATGYFDDGPRTNVLHLPVRGNGDGGAYTTAADIHALWAAFDAGRIVPAEWVTRMTTGDEYGLGFWLPEGAVQLHGYDAGVSFGSRHRPHVTHTVLSNTTEGAWPIARGLNDLLA